MLHGSAGFIKCVLHISVDNLFGSREWVHGPLQNMQRAFCAMKFICRNFTVTDNRGRHVDVPGHLILVPLDEGRRECNCRCMKQSSAYAQELADVNDLQYQTQLCRPLSIMQEAKEIILDILGLHSSQVPNVVEHSMTTARPFIFSLLGRH